MHSLYLLGCILPYNINRLITQSLLNIKVIPFYVILKKKGKVAKGEAAVKESTKKGSTKDYSSQGYTNYKRAYSLKQGLKGYTGIVKIYSNIYFKGRNFAKG